MNIKNQFLQSGALGSFVSLISFEFLMLTEKRRPNGGDVILVRAFLSALVLYLVAVGLHDYTRPTSTLKFSFAEFIQNVHETLSWFGPIFAAMYAGLYARFASQWSYLANLYNQIKSIEIRTWATLVEKKITDEAANNALRKLAEWKAGYIEDAENLHLATKASVAPIVWFWLQDEAVREAYVHATPGGNARWQSLFDTVTRVTKRLGGIAMYEGPPSTIEGSAGNG